MARSLCASQISNLCVYERKYRFMEWMSKFFRNYGSLNGGGRRLPIQRPRKEETNGCIPATPSVRSRPNKDLGADNSREANNSRDLSQRDGCKWKTENDEDLARAMEDSLNNPAYSPYEPPYFPSYEPVPVHHQNSKICGGCHHDIGNKNYLGCMGMYFHPNCFRCYCCGHPITENEFSLSGNNWYHKSCFKELTHPKCEVCFQFIPTNGAGLIEYRCHPFWSQKYCPSHEYDNTRRCCSCERLEPWNEKYYCLGDGRNICLECMESAIMDSGDCQPLYHAIRDYYEGLNMKLDQQIPMLLVERPALNDAFFGEKIGNHHIPETRGLCLSEEQTVTSVYKKPRKGNHQLVGVKTQPQKLTRKCEVTAILVLYGLPRFVGSRGCKALNLIVDNRLLTGAILAHELMHGWLRLKGEMRNYLRFVSGKRGSAGYKNLSQDVEEGICQMLSFMWLESEVSSSSSKKCWRSSVENKLGEFFLHQIANDASPAYGEGFRCAYAAVNKYGLRPTLDHIRYTGCFPL